jgi:hypothetical protein
VRERLTAGVLVVRGLDKIDAVAVPARDKRES